MSILDLMSQQLDKGTLTQLSAAIGADEQQTQSAISAALPALMGAMAHNTSNREGAEALHGAVARDHDGSLIDDLSGMLGGAAQQHGSGIVGHLLGGKQQNVEQGVAASSGLDAASASKLMAMLAPLLMGAVGRKQREENLDAGGLSQVLGQERQELEQQAPQQMSLIGKMLDTDGDGDFDMSDIMKHGMKMFFKRD